MGIGFFSTQVAFDIGSKNTYLATSTGFFAAGIGHLSHASQKPSNATKYEKAVQPVF